MFIFWIIGKLLYGADYDKYMSGKKPLKRRRKK
jgi:hypothetical protein